MLLLNLLFSVTLIVKIIIKFMQKLALGLEYDGISYSGWQKQRNVSSVQEHIEHALRKVTSEKIKVYCAGRTDSGVHALGQVVHFETNVQRPDSAWMCGVNYYLPNSICVKWVSVVDASFHARFSAISRRYCYVVYNNFVRSAILLGKVWHYKRFLDVYKMAIAGQYLLGENDFSSFRASGCQSHSVKRKIYHLHVRRKRQCVLIDIKANSFMYRMVRNIVGSLVEVGCGRKSITWILKVLRSSDRSLAGITAPASGLYLIEIEYPLNFKIPSVVTEKFWE